MCRCYSLFQITALVEEQSISFLPANCGDPTVPTNGSIGTYQNTSVGTKIVFGCNPGFIPAGNMTAVCASDGSWTPDPATLVCKCKSSYIVACSRESWVEVWDQDYNVCTFLCHLGIWYVQTNKKQTNKQAT